MSCKDCLSGCYNSIFAGNLSLSQNGQIHWSAARTTIAAIVGVASLILITAGACGLVKPNWVSSLNFRGYNFLATPLHCAVSEITGIFLAIFLLIGLRSTQEKEIQQKQSY